MKINYLEPRKVFGGLKAFFDKKVYATTLSKISFFLDKKTSITYAEFGPGNGDKFMWFCEYFGDSLKEAHFFDIDPNILNHLQRRNLRNDLSFMHLCDDLNDDFSCFMQFYSKFNVIVSSHVIEHIANPSSHIRLVNNLLKDGGVFYIATPNLTSKDALKKGKSWRGYLDETHINLLGHSQLEELLKCNGFKIVCSGTSTYWKSLKGLIYSLVSFEWSFNPSLSGDATNIIAIKNDC